MRLDRVVGTYHARRIVNPKIARSQAIGEIIWGTGQAAAGEVRGRPDDGPVPQRNYPALALTPVLLALVPAVLALALGRLPVA